MLYRELPFAFGIPALLWQALFLYFPVIFLFFISFIEISETHSSFSFTTNNYQIFLDPVYFGIIAKSIFQAFVNACLCLVIAYPVAYFLVFKAKNLKNFFLFLLIVPFWINFLLHIYAWFFVLERGGWINQLLLFTGLIDTPLHLLNTQFAISLGMLYCYLPFMVLPIYSTLERFDPKLIEASHDLGASSWQTFARITFPVTFPGWQSGFFLVFIPSCAEFAIPSLLGGDKQVFLGNVLSQFILGNQTLSVGAAFTVISCLCLLLCAVSLYKIAKYFLKLA